MDNWRPMVPTDNYGLNMCLKFRVDAKGVLELTAAGCATSQSNMGYVCEYG